MRRFTDRFYATGSRKNIPKRYHKDLLLRFDICIFEKNLLKNVIFRLFVIACKQHYTVIITRCA